jgi:hypothetical protein
MTISAANTAGTLDPTFGSRGVATVNGTGVARALVTLQADGRILVLAAGFGGSRDPFYETYQILRMVRVLIVGAT